MASKIGEAAALDTVALLRASVNGDQEGMTAALKSMSCSERCWSLLFLTGFTEGLLAEIAQFRDVTVDDLLDEALERWTGS